MQIVGIEPLKDYVKNFRKSMPDADYASAIGRAVAPGTAQYLKWKDDGPVLKKNNFFRKN